MTEKFEQFINNTFKTLIEADGEEQSPEEVAVVTNVGKQQNQKSMLKRAIASGPEKRAGKAVKTRETALKGKLPGMLDKYEDETSSIESGTK